MDNKSLIVSQQEMKGSKEVEFEWLSSLKSSPSISLKLSMLKFMSGKSLGGFVQGREMEMFWAGIVRGLRFSGISFINIMRGIGRGILNCS